MTAALERLVDNGRKEGAMETTVKFVRNMAADGISFDKIVRYTGASADEVERIIDRMGKDSQAQIS